MSTTDVSADIDSKVEAQGSPSPVLSRVESPIVPQATISGRALVAIVAMEMLKRIAASLRAKKAELDAGAQSALLALGKYVAESMHGFNNALTAVLGNAELLQLDAANLSPQMQEEIEAIHSNALRLHEMMQRFSSLEAEIEAGRKQGKSEGAAAAQAYLSGT